MLRSSLGPMTTLLGSVLVAALVGGCGEAPPPAEITLDLPEPSPPLVDVVLMLDQSGSMNGPNGTDPQGVRVEAARYLIASVSEKSSESSPNRVGIVDFGDKASPSTATLRVVSPSDGYEEAAGSVALRDLGGTNTIGALRAAFAGLQAAGGAKQGRNCRLVLFTDGRPEDDRRLSQHQYFAEIREFVEKQLKPAGCELYVIAVDLIGDVWNECSPRWKQILGDDKVVRITSVDQLRGTFNQVINSIFSIPNVPPDVLTTGRKSFTVRPYLDRVEFHVFPSTPEMKVRIDRPDGSTVTPGRDADVRRRQFKGYEIISVFDPAAGEWDYEVTAGKGRVEVFRNEVPLRMELVLPTATHPQGKTMSIVASFARHSGKPVDSAPDNPLGLSAQVTAPTGEPVNVQFGKPVAGLYYGETAVPTKLPGTYRVVLRVQAGTALDTSTSYNVQVEALPYLALDPPKVGGLSLSQQYLTVQGQLMLSGKPAEAARHFSNHPNLLYVAQLSDMPEGGKSPVQWLSSKSGTHFATRFSLPMRKRLIAREPIPGAYVLHLEHAGKTPAGDAPPDSDVSMQVVNVQGSSAGPLVLALQLLIAAYLLVVVLSWAWLLLRLFTARRMSLDIRITHARTGEALANTRSSGRRTVWARTRRWKEAEPAKGKRGVSVRPRRLVFWGIDRAGTQVGIARFVWGLAIPSRMRKGQTTSIGLIRIQS